jgi:MucR family transcriptional regulator, transcriptional regulator of exopolysaccharide biosynthesis
MGDSSNIQKVDPELIAEIVSSYVANHNITAGQLEELISTVHRTLSTLGTNAPASSPAAEKLTPAVPIRRSVEPDYVVCLECGFRAKTLRRHLRVAHGLEPAAYRERWKLAGDHPMAAPTYSADRSAMAKERGLGRRVSSPDETPAARRPWRSQSAPGR